MDSQQILRIFPSANVIQSEQIPSDYQNDFAFMLEYVKTQLASNDLTNPNPRSKAAIRSMTSSNIPVLEVYIDLLREHITSLQLDSLDKFTTAFFTTTDKCTHLANVSQFSYQQSQLLKRSCSSTFESLFFRYQLMELTAQVFKQNLFVTADNDSLHSLITLTNLLRGLSLPDKLEEIIIDLTIDFASKKIHHQLAGNLSCELASLKAWASAEMFPTLLMFLPPDNFNEEMLHEVIVNEVVKLRTHEIFQLVSQFPSSTGSLNELRFSLKSHFQREQLVNTFIHSCNDSLLHAGTDTVKIIQFYMKTVRSFLVIDPRGVLLDKCCRPIRKYLRTREDTVEKIVNGLLDRSRESELGELAEELFNTKTNSVEVDDINDLNWTPDPIDLLPDFRKRKVGDLIESLFSIFDSKLIFIEAIIKRISLDLINLLNFDVRDVVNTLNVLKLRFGEDEFTMIDVMIQDIVQSALVDKHLKPDKFHTTIISHLFWPVEEYLSDYPVAPLLSDTMVLHSANYSKIKKGRKLELIPSLGTVNLDLEFDNGKVVNFVVSPDKATVIYSFEEKSEQNIESILSKLYMEVDTVKEIVEFWIKKGVLYEKDSLVYAVNEEWSN